MILTGQAGSALAFKQSFFADDVYHDLAFLLRACRDTREFMLRQKTLYNEAIKEARAYLRDSAVIAGGHQLLHVAEVEKGRTGRPKAWLHE